MNSFDPSELVSEQDYLSGSQGIKKPEQAAKKGLGFNPSELVVDKEANQGFIGTLADGTKSAARSIGATVDTYAGDAQGVIDKSKDQSEQRSDIDLEKFNADVAKNTGMGGDEEAGLWDSVKGVGRAIASNPRGAGLAVVEQLPNAVPALAGGYAGMKAGAAVGAAAGAPFAGVGSAPGAFIGGVVGGLSGMFLGNTLIETGGKAMEYAQDGDFTPEEISQTKKEGAVKAGVITAIDGLTLGVGGKISGAMRRTTESAVESATQKVLLDAGVDISDTAAVTAAKNNPALKEAVTSAQQNAAKITDTLRRRGVEAGTLLTVESIGEGFGEYLGELAATGEASVPEAVLESFLSLGQSGVEAAWNMRRAREQSSIEQEWQAEQSSLESESSDVEANQKPAGFNPFDQRNPAAKINLDQVQKAGVTPAPVFDPQDIASKMGINPDDGPLSAAAAQSVNSGLFSQSDIPQAGINQSTLERAGVTQPPVLDTDQIDRNLGSIDPLTGEYMPAPAAIGQQGDAEVGAGSYEYDRYGNLSKVDGRTVKGYGEGQPRLGFNAKAERSTAPLYEVSPDGVARPATGEAARSRKESIDLSSLRNGKQQAQKTTPKQSAEQRTPEQNAQSIWDNLNTFERNAAATKVLGMRGVPAKNAATKAWDKLSTKQQAKLTAGLDAQQGQRWTDPNQKVADQVGPVLQNRDRTSQDSINQMREISNKPDYSRLKTSGFLSDGAPVAIDENIKVPASQLGVTDTASAGGKKFNVQYAVVEADQFLTSNSIDGTPNTEYAAGSTDKARAIAGNGRITGLQSAWAKGKADQYKADMAADKMHGIDAAVIEGMKKPILIRLLPQDQITDNIGDLSNRDEKGKLSPVEQAKTDMGRLDLDSLKFTAEGAIGGEAIHQFRMAQPAAERVSEAEARKRLTSAIFQKAYGNDQLTEIQAGESEDAKSIMSALAQAAPSMSRLEGAGEFDVRPIITQAGIAAVNAARRGTRLADYVQQSEMGIDPNVYPILEMMLNEKGNIRSSKYIGEQLTNMAKLAYDEANSPGSDMFGEKPKRTSEQVIQDALTGVQGYGQINDGRGQESLGQRGRPESDAQMAEGPEGGRERPADTGQVARAQPEAEQGQPATVENEVPEKWRTNYLRAAKVARDIGIDPKQHKKLVDLVAAIDAFNAEPVASQPQQQVAAAKPAADNKTSVHIDNAIDLTGALAAIARGAQLSTEPNGDVILSGTKIITLPKQPTSVDEVIGALAVALRDQMRADGVSMPGNPTDMTRDQFVVAYHFANIIPDFEITNDDIGTVIDTSGYGLTVDADKLYDKIIEQTKDQAKPALELNQQTEESLAKDAERLEQLQKEEAAQKAKQKAEESKARERDADKARADEVVDDFQLGQPAEDAMSGMGDIFDTKQNEAKPASKPSKPVAPRTELSAEAKEYAAILRRNANDFDGIYKGSSLKPVAIDFAEHAIENGNRMTDAELQGLADKHGIPLDIIEQLSSNHFTYEGLAFAAEQKILEARALRSEAREIKTNKEAAQTKPTEAVEDYGEKMDGAIKDQPINSISKYLTDEEIASMPLSKLWPANEPLSIEDNYAAAFSYAARQNIPAKPRLKYKVKRWVDAVKSMREIAKAVQDGEITKDNIGALSKTNDTVSSVAAKANLLSGLDRKHWSRIGRVDVSDNAYIFDDNRNKVPSPHATIMVDGRGVLVKGKYDNDSVTAVIKASLEMAEQSDVSKRGQFEIRENRNTGEIFINRKGDKEYRKLKTFPKGSLKEARDFVNNKTNELVAAWEAIKERDNVNKADVRSDTNRERSGIDYRNGKDVTSEEFGKTFGFRGVEFGNWVSQGKGKADRQGMLNAAYDALLDLAAVVGIPPKAISLNGSLGIAFGSRGKGKASAHYETDNIVINLTKTKGAGSLAHEWFHALDNYFSRRRGVTPFDGNNAAYNKANYITYKPEPMMALKTSLNKQGLRPYLITKAEYDRKAERGVNFDPAEWTPDTNHPIGVRPTVEKAFAAVVSELDKSPMLQRSEKIDKGKVDGYWSSIIERAARSFESYVIQRLEDQGIKNDYLANVVPIDAFQRNVGRYPYLTTEELKPVAEKFDTLFNAIETREEKDGNFLMFSRHNNQPSSPTTNASLLKNINDNYPALTSSVLTMIQRGREGKKGGLVIVDSNNGADIAKAYSKATGLSIAQANRLFSDGESINGFYDTKSGITFLVGPNLDATTAPAVLLHEVTHSQQRNEIDARSMKLINGRAKEKNASLKAFLDTVSQRMIDAGEYGNPLESTSYIVEQAVMEGRSQGYTLADSKFLNAIEKTLGSTVANIIRDFTKMVRQFALRHGLPIKVTIDDLVQYAMAGMEQASRGNVDGGVQYSKNATEDRLEGRRQFEETEKAYGGRAAYDQAKSEGKTKLNYQQWVQVRTPAFKDWFGDWENAGRERIDKARHVRRAQAGYKQEAAADTREAGGREDRNRVGTVLYGAGTLMDLETGEPRVFYHGTSEDIKAFNLNHPTRKDSGWLGRGVYVASDVRMANTYANTKNGSAAPNVMPVFIRSTSGLYQATLSDKQVGSGLSQENIDKATEALKQRGYDGAYLEFQSDSTIELVTYSVNNVKSASGNVGTFSAATDDISFSRSQTKTAAFKKQFGDSKVVDASGDPLLVYHGSGAKFATFDKNKRGATTRAKSAEEGFFFTSSKSLAYDFKKQAEGAAADLDAIRGAVEGLSDSQLESLASDIGRIASEDLDLEGRDFFIDSLMDMYQHDTDINTWPEESNGTPKALKNYIPRDILEPGAIHDVYLRIENPHEHVFDEDDDWHDEGAITRAISTAQKNGNDGVILRNMVDVARADEKGNNAIRSDVYIAFEPDQIIQSEDSAGIRFSRAANPASVNAAPNGMAAWDSPSASKFDDFVYKIQDKHVDTKRVIAAIRDTGKAISDDLDVYLQETLFHGRAAKRTQDFLNMEVNPLIEYMQSAKVDMSDLEEFLHARHAQEANALIAKRDPNMPDGGSGMTNAEAAKYLKSLNGVRRKQFENAAKMVDKIIGGTRETIVNYGLESKETVDGWANGFKHYIPLQREDKDGQMGIGQGFSVKGKETKGRTGSTRKVVDILANVMMQRERIIVRGEKNRVAAALLGLAKDNPLPDFWKVDVVPTNRVIDKTTGLVRNQVDPTYKSRDNAVVAKVNGKEHAILMSEDDPRAMRMAEALKNLDAAQLEGLLGATATATRYFAAVNTQYNPIFGVTNFVRDIQEAMLHLQSTPLEGQQARLFKNTFTAVKAVMKAERDGRKGQSATGKWGKLWDDFQNTGGQTGYRDQFSDSSDRGKAIQKALTPDGWAETGLGKFFTVNGTLKAPLEIVRKKAGWLFDLLSDYNTAMENGVRLSAYETGINSGMSKEQAAALAKSLTVNFNRKGQVTQQVGALYAFFNASVQGSARLGQSLFDMEPGKPKTMRLSKLGKRIVSGGVLLGASQAVLLAMMGFDDDEPPEFIRERNIIIPTGDKTYISIPMPLGYHVIANLGRIPTEFALSGGKDGAKYLFNLMDVMADIYNPIGNSGLSMQTIAPTVLDPLAGLAENKDFAGRAIAKESFNRQTPGHTLARDTASLPATWLSEAINYATGGTEFTRGELSPTPDQIDYLVGQLTGGVGRETTKFLQSSQAVATGDELPWHKIPLAGRFIGDADSDGAKQSAFYNNMDKVRKHAEEVKGLRASGRSGEAVEYANKHPHAKLHLAARAAEKQVKGMRDRKRELEQAGAPREEIRALEKRMIQRMEQFVELSAASK